MGMGLIVPSQSEVTASVNCTFLMDWMCSEGGPGNSSDIRPYPKPTQVDRSSRPRRLRELC